MKKLSDIKDKSRIRFVKIIAEKKIKQRLFQLGILEGGRGEIIKFSPFKTNILIKANGNLIGVRSKLAENIMVEQI
jgi:Fe2+ transport system protein FeoA